MEFCPKCGSVMVEKKKNFGCVRCVYIAKSKPILKTSEKIEEKSEIGVVRKKDTDVFPIVAANCVKCGNKEAYFWTAQTRAGDEAETRFFKCTKCEHTWREYH